jgi:sphingomyelin phosphodiesterase
LKVLQFTDVHIDPNYAEGYDAECKTEPTCCRMDQGIPANESQRAGYWGDYRNCDAPLYAFDNQVQEAATRHQVKHFDS